MLGWIHYGGGYDLYRELQQQILKLNVVGFLTGPMPTQPLGWFKKEITSPEDLRNLKYRTVGLAADLFKEMGVAVTILPGGEIVPAIDRGLIDGAEFNNPSSDRVLGFPDVSRSTCSKATTSAWNASRSSSIRQKYDGAGARAAGDPQVRRRSRFVGHVVEGAGPLLEGSRDETSEARRQGYQDAGLRAGSAVAGLGQGDRGAVQEPFFKKVIDSQKAWTRRVSWLLQRSTTPT